MRGYDRGVQTAQADPAPMPVPRRPLIATLTLGCKLNQAESQALARRLTAAGCDVIDRPAPADATLINTCSVTHVADRKARRLIRMSKRLSPGAPVVVTGCYAEWAGELLRKEAGADIVLPNREKAAAAEAVLQALRRSPPAGGRAGPGTAATGRTRAFLKIQEGCDDVCAFCIVPRVRGRERARPVRAIVAEAQALEASGVLEVVLTGTQPGAYGRDRADGTNAAALLEALLTATSLPRIRYSSLQPQDVTDDLLARWQDGRLCPHFHLALQSGSGAVLGRMRRRYDAQGHLDALARIRAAQPGAAITSDVIVGFPGETEADFAATLDVCGRAAFADVHVFPYSQRPRTSAAKLPDDVPPKTKRARLAAVQAVAREGRTAFRAGLDGTIAPVLIETRRGAGAEAAWHGLSDSYAPVRLPLPAGAEGDDLRNRLLPLHLTACGAGALLGRVVG